MLTRKQLWRKCKIINYTKNDNENNKIIKIIPNDKLKKKVRFSNIVYLTLIPTKDEINKLKYNYDFKNHNISNKIATIP